MNLRVIVRRALSLFRRVTSCLTSIAKIIYLRMAFPEIVLPFSVVLDKGATLVATDGGIIEVGRNVYFGPDTQCISRGGRIVIGDDIYIGRGSIIVSQASITIGRYSQIAEYVVIRDQDHNYLTRPIMSSGFLLGAILIGEDCWLGSKSTVLRGSNIGDGVVVGAHSLVRGNISPYTLAVGCPTKVIKKLPLHKKNSISSF